MKYYALFFSPVKSKYFQIFLTGVYFLLLVSIICFLYIYLVYRFEYNIGKNISAFSTGGFILLLIPPLVLTTIIHKSLLKGLSTFVGLLMIYIVYVSFILGFEDGYAIIVIIGIIPFLIGMTCVIIILGILARGFFRLKSKLVQTLILLAPFIIIVFMLGINIVGVQNSDLAYCDGIHNIMTQKDCYYNVALREQKPSICIKIFERVSQEKCLRELYAQISPEMCDELNDNENSKDKSICLWIIADKNENISICEDINDTRIKRSCKGISEGRYYFGDFEFGERGKKVRSQLRNLT